MLNTYKDTAAKRVRADILSYTYRFDDSDFPSVPDGQFIRASIDEFTIGLQRTGTGNAYIDGLEEFYYDNYIGTTSLLENVFLDVLSYLNYPSWTIAAMFNNAKGSITGSDATNNTYIHVNVRSGYIVNFDSDYNSLIFQLDSNVPNETTNFNAYADFVYVIDCYNAAFYVDTEQATEALTMTF